MRIKLGDVCKHDLQKYKITYKCTGFLLDVFLVRVDAFVFYIKPCPLVYMLTILLPVHTVQKLILGRT